jgi:hypothetical protein
LSSITALIFRKNRNGEYTLIKIKGNNFLREFLMLPPAAIMLLHTDTNVFTQTDVKSSGGILQNINLV